MRFSEDVVNKIITECIKRCEQEFNDSVYNECLEAVKQSDLRNVVELKNTLRRFLYVWGRMGRILGRREYRKWESRLVKQIALNHKELEEFRIKDLTRIVLDEYEQVIKRCYESFKRIVGPIAAVKTLHMICPNFFPLWDNDIAEAIRKERANRKDEEFLASDYYEFMKDIQRFVNGHQQVLSDLAREYHKGKLRILDEFLWWMVHRPLSLILG
jgi:hypothetical protein